jgi:hypothetical protein
MSTTKATLFALLIFGCASAPPQPPAAPPPQRQPKITATAAANEAPPPAAVSVLPRRKLGPGQCEDGFDCVDTVGFPPSGQRWACVQGKCNRVPLPSLLPDGATGSQESSQVSSRKATPRKR